MEYVGNANWTSPKYVSLCKLASISVDFQKKEKKGMLYITSSSTYHREYGDLAAYLLAQAVSQTFVSDDLDV